MNYKVDSSFANDKTLITILRMNIFSLISQFVIVKLKTVSEFEKVKLLTPTK